MVKVVSGGVEFYLDGYLKKNLDSVKVSLTKDFDFPFVVDGFEGGGKSVVAMQVCKYLDPTFNIDRVCFNPQDFIKRVKEANKFEAILFDEALTGSSARESMTSVNITINKMLGQVRQKNLIIGVVIPSFFDLDKVPALWRTKALLHIYLGDDMSRGFFRFYNYSSKKDLYVKGKKYYNYNCQKPSFFGRFTSAYVIDEKAYRKKKFDSLNALGEERMDKRSARYMAQRDAFVYWLAKIENYSVTSISKKFNELCSYPMDRHTMTKVVEEFKLPDFHEKQRRCR